MRRLPKGKLRISPPAPDCCGRWAVQSTIVLKIGIFILHTIGTSTLLFVLAGASLLEAVFTWNFAIETKGLNLESLKWSRTDQFSLTTMKSFSQRSVPSALFLFSRCANILSVLPASPSG